MWFFSILKCSEDSEIPNSIFYVVGVRYKFIWQNATEPFSKMPEAKKQTLSLKKQFCFKRAYKIIWKKRTEPSSKMHEPKKTNTLIEKPSLLEKNL